MEDHQVVSYLASHLRKRGCETHLANPKQLKWRNGIAFLDTDWANTELHAIVRFYQGEWLSQLPRRLQWTHFFRGGHTPVGNPGVAMISESKRFPLTWDRIKTSLPAWKTTLPETRDPRDCPWQTDQSWLLKAALSNTGDEVCIREWMTDRKWRRLRWNIRIQPNSWVAQRRFEAVPLDTPIGPMHVCLGVYAINGRTAGIYARLAPRALIDYTSMDVAVLIADEDDEGRTI
jgi:glutathionylspermidine synthase